MSGAIRKVMKILKRHRKTSLLPDDIFTAHGQAHSQLGHEPDTRTWLQPPLQFTWETRRIATTGDTGQGNTPHEEYTSPRATTKENTVALHMEDSRTLCAWHRHSIGEVAPEARMPYFRELCSQRQSPQPHPVKISCFDIDPESSKSP